MQIHQQNLPLLPHRSRTNFCNRHNPRNPSGPQTKFCSTVPGLEDDIFDIGATANPASFNQVLEKIKLYIQKNYKEPRDIVTAIQNRTRMSYAPSTRPVQGTKTNAEFTMDVFNWHECRKANSVRERIYKAHESNAWALIFDQCSTGLKTQLEGAPGYAFAQADDNIITLISLIQGFCCHFDQQSQAYMAIVETFKNLCLYFSVGIRPTMSISRTSLHLLTHSRRMGVTVLSDSSPLSLPSNCKLYVTPLSRLLPLPWRPML